MVKKIIIGCLLIGVGVSLTLGFLITWMELYSDHSDPKNIYYVLWKHGLNKNKD